MKELARVIPVLDILDGMAVRAVGGRRCEYIPVESPIASSPDPLLLVKNMSKRFGFDLFYIADLDAIMGKGSNLGVIHEIVEKTACSYLLDGGYESMADVLPLPRTTPVIATETFEEWDSPGDLSQAVASIDIYRGNIISRKYDLTIQNALDTFRSAGVRRFIVIHLDAVGMDSFDPASLIEPMEGEEWMAGGGISRKEHLSALAQKGYSAALVSSAIHRGDLP